MTPLLWSSNAPWSSSGYGNQTRLFAPRFRDAGFDVALNCFYGLEGGMIQWSNFHCYPTDHSRFGALKMADYARHHAGGEAKDCLVFTLQDVWPLLAAHRGPGESFNTIRDLNWLCWTPVDHDPAPPMVVQFLKEVQARVVSISKHGQKAFQSEGIDALYVPHGIETSIFKPRPDLRVQCRDELNVPADAFVVGMVANNQGLPSRKAYPQAFEAFAKFSKKRDDAVLYVHADVLGLNGGVNLIRLAQACGIPAEKIRTSDQLMLHLGIPQQFVAGVFNVFDVLLMPSLGEGFGIPLIEAQACFPASTPVQAEDILAFQAKPYTGDLYTITTERGSFEATADHPIWTTQGWQSAECVQPGDHVLYCHAPEGMEQIHTGTIGDVVRGLQDDALAASVRSRGNALQRSLLPIAEAGTTDKAVLGFNPAASSDALRIRSLLLRRADRRRGDGNDSEGESRLGSELQLSALLDSGEHGQAADRLADGDLSAAPSVRQQGYAAAKHCISLLARGAWLPASVRGASTKADPQGRHLGVGHRVDAGAVVAIEDGPLDDIAARDHLADPRSQYETVTSVTRRRVEDETVYNLVTASGGYRVGAGYLVHNCGIPVITSEWTAMTELCGAGWLVEGDKWWDETQAAYQKVPRVGSIVEALEASYKHGEGLKDRAVKFAADYDVDKVMSEQWKPILDEVVRPREIPPLKVAA